MSTTIPEPTGMAPVVAESQANLSRRLMLIGLGLFVTSLAQDKVLGNLPIKNLLKNQLHLGAGSLAAFFAISAFAWYFKPLAGLLVDGFPLFGTRRRYYLLLSSLLAGVCWLLMGIVPHAYQGLLALAVLMNVAVMIASAIVGGLLVETGQAYNATGRLSSLRMILMNAVGLIAGPLGGFLAERAFGLTTAIGAGLLLTLAIATWLLLHEKLVHQRNTEALRETYRQLTTLLRSRTLWSAAMMTFLVYIAPGFSTPLYYYQTDTLHFSQQFIGNLAIISGVTGIAAAFVYGVLCRKLTLRLLLVAGIIINAVGTLAYLAYRSHASAMVIEGLSGIVSTLALLPLFDLAARATPKGSESMGYALLMSVSNVAMSLSDVIGSWLFEKHHVAFMHLVWLNSATTALVLIAVPFLPRLLMNQRDD